MTLACDFTIKSTTVMVTELLSYSQKSRCRKREVRKGTDLAYCLYVFTSVRAANPIFTLFFKEEIIK